MTNRKFITSVLLAFVFVSAIFSQAGGTVFEYKFTKGETSRILSTVDEEVYINGMYVHTAKILNRIFCKTTDVDKAGGTTEATFMTSETSSGSNGQNFSWGNKYESTFHRTKTGIYKISDDYFMPTVRDVPVFPEKKLKVGDMWTGDGHEAHDMRETFGVTKPFKVPFTASYQYLRDEVDSASGKTFAVFEVQYNIAFRSPATKVTEEQLNNPAMTAGFSHQTIYWNSQKGAIDHYTEDFNIEVTTYAGDKITFRGTANAHVNETEQTATTENLKKISESVTDMGLQNIDVKRSDKGIIISVENIQFKADSSVLEESEKTKLRNIANILKKYKNDLLISGYCANIGTIESQKVLSEERAASVAQFLTGLGVRPAEAIFTEGKGSENPLASDATAEGRAKNRRVEITIVDE